MKISILIPTVRRHTRQYNHLIVELRSQILPYAGEIEILTDDHEYDNVGMKRNRLLERATGEYLCFFDSDDIPAQNYIESIMQAAESGDDCASLMGMYYVDDRFDGIFEHSLKYDSWATTDRSIKYERYPNHLNLIRSEIAKRFKFPDKSYGEDHDWSKQIHEAGVLKTEFLIPDIIYHYKYETKKV